MSILWICGRYGPYGSIGWRACRKIQSAHLGQKYRHCDDCVVCSGDVVHRLGAVHGYRNCCARGASIMFAGMVHIFALMFACRTSIQEPSVEIQVRPDDEPSEEPETDTALRDVDEDGFTEDVDCDDWNPNVYPGALEILNDVDDDCDGYVDGDGLYVGSLSMTAMAIYQGQPYHFTQVCDGTPRTDCRTSRHVVDLYN